MNRFKISTRVAALAGLMSVLLLCIGGLGLWGLVHLLRRRRDEGVVVSAAVVIAFLLLQAGWVNPWGGEMPGPRYLIPMLPFLGIGLAAVWHRVPAPVARFVLGISIASMGLAAVTDHLIGPGGLALTSSLRTLVTEGPNPTVWSLLLGPVGWVVYGASVVAALVLVVRWSDLDGAGVGGGVPHALDGVALGDVEHPLEGDLGPLGGVGVDGDLVEDPVLHEVLEDPGQVGCVDAEHGRARAHQRVE